MKRIPTTILTILPTLALSPVAACAEGFGVNVGGGTTGLAVEAVQKLGPNFDLRFGIHGLKYSISYKYDDVDYDIDQSIAMPVVFLDWRPMAGKFRMTAGVAYYNNVGKLQATPDPYTYYTIGNNSYLGSEIGTVNGKANYHTGAPYLGAGWDLFFGQKQNIGVALDVGAVYRNRADVTLTSTLSGTTPGLANDLAVEAGNIRGDLPKFHPLFNIGAAFRF
jgi:hypothetical protein